MERRQKSLKSCGGYRNFILLSLATVGALSLEGYHPGVEDDGELGGLGDPPQVIREHRDRGVELGDVGAVPGIGHVGYVTHLSGARSTAACGSFCTPLSRPIR